MRLRALCTAVVVFVLGTSGAAQARVSAAEREALVAIYEALNGPSWSSSQRANWLGAEGTECTWGGVSCGGTGRVILLNLFGLSGTLPDVFDAFSELRGLSLSGGTALTGDPAVLLELPEVASLSLFARGITADLPSFTSLDKLGSLQLQTSSSNPMPSFSGFQDLSYLYLFTNNTGTFTAADNPGLSSLLVGAPVTTVDWDGLASLPSLTSLYVSSLAGGELPNPQVGFPAIQYFDVVGRGRVSNFTPGPISSSFCARPLRGLSLVSTNRTGEIPTCLAELPLTGLYLSDNNFDPGPIPDFSAMNLNALDLAEANRTGEIPEWIWDKEWSYLSLEHNSLVGGVSPRIGELSDLFWIRLDGNRLSGQIPPEILDLPSGACVNLQFNALSTGDPEVVAAVNAHQNSTGCVATAQRTLDFRKTETVAPRNVSAAPGDDGEVEVTWNPIRYQTDSGEYVIYAATSSTGPFTIVGRTTSKSDSSFTVTGLTSGQQYFFLVRTLTRGHVLNANRVVSPPSEATSAVAP